MSQKAITSAFVLSAGFGTRLQPLTHTLPKPLLEICGEPLILKIFNSLVRAGISKIYVNTHHLAHRFDEFFKDMRGANGYIVYKSAHVVLVNEKQILDTGGGLKNILPLLDKNESILVYNGDILCDLNIEDFLKFAHTDADKNRAATLCLLKEGNNLNVSCKDGKVCDMRFALKAPHDFNAQFTGIFAAHPNFLNALEKYPKEVFSTVDVFLEFLKTSPDSISAYFDEKCSWNDIGTFDEYMKINSGFDSTAQILKAKLKDANLDANGMQEIKKGASTRSFYRAKTNFGNCIACFYSAEKRENYLYAPLAQFLHENKFPVPKILLHDAKAQVLIMDDVGEKDLLSIEKNKRVEKYFEAVEHISRLHNEVSLAYIQSKNPPTLCEKFDGKLYDWESSYFIENCVKERFKLELEPSVAELKFIKTCLMSQTQCLVHRDLQAQNIMVNEDGKVNFIDFQGMRFGCAYYDLASLIFDPYAELDIYEREALLQKYSRNPDRLLLYIAACQRLMQALGAYGFLSIKKQKPEYENYFRPALNALAYCAERAGLEYLENIAKLCLEKLASV